MPLRVLTSTRAQKVEYFNGLEVDVHSSTGTFKFAYNNSRRVCMFQPPTSGPTQELKLDDWKPMLLFPDLSTYKQEEDELVGGIMCQKFTLTASHGTTGIMNDKFSFYWDPVLLKPVRWHQHARSVPFGSHTDEYIIDYVSFQPETPSAHDLDLPDAMCKNPVQADVAVRAAGIFGQMQKGSLAGKVAWSFLATSMSKDKFLLYRGGKAKGSSKSRRTSEHQRYVREHVASGSSLPTDFDWRTARPGVIGPVKDQAMCGSCWAYGAIGPVESALAVKSGSLKELPEQFLVDCAWTNGTGTSGQNSGCDGGDSDIGILEVVRKYGGVIPSAAAYGSYLGTNGYCKDIRRMEVGAKVSGWADVKKNDIEGLKDAIVQKGAISVGIMVPDSMLYYDSGVLDTTECACDEKQIDHAVEVVGYGVDSKGVAYWTVRNSWSTYWGDAGYIKIAQGENDCCVTAQAGYPIVDDSASVVV
eukprot:TRINITY_DN21232_c0_g1_i1.p1 TRINITY_DN21232_c0_g1~~TRINITY_DN21232_c0_g1_i1.p1  ORF type:complete len:534 (+),score=85.26 TRINITY_DN21232_c0_g1_i1:189-1604(+)